MSPFLVLLALAAGPVKAPTVTTVPTSRARPNAFCTGTYADDFSALSKSAMDLATKTDSNFTYCVRATATYECLSYNSDGSIKRTRRETTSHGTAFAYKKQGGETLLLTNQHVAEYHSVTDDEHPVSSIPSGCKRIADALRIVDNEKDSFPGDDIPLNKVVTDPLLDMTVVKARAALNVMPWKVGRSSGLRDRNVVEVRGFPLGAFKATAQGRVTSAYDHDDYGEWDHDDFVVDAQLSHGNSGSPVMAVSCATGEFELVGVYHAEYARGRSLNVVVHSDQLRELMTTLKRSTPVHSDATALNSQARQRLLDDSLDMGQLFLPFGGLTVLARPREDGALVYAVYGRDFPSSGWPVVVIEDLDTSHQGGFGTVESVWFGTARGLYAKNLDDLEDADHLTMDKTIDALRRLSILVSGYRAASARAAASREASEELSRVEKELRRTNARSKDVAAALLELSDRETPDLAPVAIPPGRPFIHAAPTEAVSRPIPASAP